MYLIKTFDLEVSCKDLEELKVKLADMNGQSVSIQYPASQGEIDNLFVHIMEDGTVVETYNRQKTVDLNNLHL
ncbi:hypothetical protein [Litoribacillus peritrichatus]|uniref:ABC transporter ATP-binding protein n=1 Tax=Litoribacillus peritrichatus TaxID=718191 RepID=A0ABP7N1Z2_9GAMM